MALAVLLAQKDVRFGFDLDLEPVIALIAGIVILVFPRALGWIVGIYLIAIGLIGLFNINI